jgi:hypothetical protein
MVDRSPQAGGTPHLDDVARLLVEVLAETELEVDDLGDNRWMTMLSGQYKRTIPLHLVLGERSLTVTSMFASTLDGGHREVYELLLHRNQRARHVHFALDDEGQLVLVGRVPRAAITGELLQELLGELLTVADGAFNAVLRAGFADYIAHEQAWRERTGQLPNPVTTTED